MIKFLSLSFFIIWVFTHNLNQNRRKLQEVVGSDLRLRSALQKDPKAQVAALSAGFLVCWQSLRSNSANTYEILAQSFSLNGSPTGTVFQVDPLSTTSQETPNVVNLRDGRLVVAWTGINETTTKLTPFGQILDTSGAKVGGKFAVDSKGIFSQFDQTEPNLGALEDKGFAITWTNSSSTVWLQIYFPNGTEKGSPIKIFDGANVPPHPQVVGLYSGDIVVLETFSDDLLAKIISNDGNEIIRENFGVNNISNVDSQYIKATSDGFLIIYASKGTSNYKSIYAQYFNFDGDPINDEVIMHQATLNNDSTPFLTILDDQCFILSFDAISPTTGSDIYFKKFNPDGNVLLNETSVNTVKTGDQYGNNGALLTNKNFVIIWNELDTGTNQYNINAKIFSHGYDPFELVQNSLIIRQGERKIIKDTEINTIGNGNIIYTAKYVTNGYFSLISNPDTAILSFSQLNIDNFQIYFTHDGSSLAPFYYLQSTNGTYTSNFTKVEVTFNLLPYFTVNTLKIEQNTEITITDAIINGYAAKKFVPIFIVWQTTNCHFAYKTDTKTPISSFTANEISKSLVSFVAYNTSQEPSYSLGIKDGDDYVTNSTGNIIYFTSLKVLKNEMTITQKETLTITRDMLDVEIDPKLIAKFMVSYREAGYFAYKTKPKKEIMAFSSEDISKGEIIFVHSGKNEEPYINFLISDGFITIEAVKIKITYIPLYKLNANKLIINKGQTITVNKDFLMGSSVLQKIKPETILLKVSKLTHGKFTKNFQSINLFTLDDLLGEEIMFEHDGSSIAPYYEVSIGVEDQSIPLPVVVSFDGKKPYPIFLKNELCVNEGETTFYTPFDLLANDGINSNFKFTIKIVSNSYFAYRSNLSNPITTFFQNEVNESLVALVHDDSKNIPYYEISVSTIDGWSNNLYFTPAIYFNNEPELLINTLFIEKGEKKIITAQYLSANDIETHPNELIFCVSNVFHGRFENIDEPSIPILLFYQSDIKDRKILFVHDGSDNPPEYYVSVTDGDIKIKQSQAIVDFSVAKGMCGLKKTTSVKAEMLRGIAVTSTTDYVIGALYKGMLVVIGINDPEYPRILQDSNLDLSKQGIQDLSEVTFDDNSILYVLSDTHTLVTVSYKDPRNPVFLGSIGSAKTVNDLTLCGNDYIYIAANNEGVHIVNVIDKANPRVEATIPIQTNATISSPDCFDEFLYLVSSEVAPRKSKLMVFSIIDPKNPELISDLDLSDSGNYVKINKNQNRAFVTTDSGIDMIDLKDPKFPKLAKTVLFSKEILSLDISEDDMYLSIISDLTVVLLNVEDIYKPGVLETLYYEDGLNQPLFLPNSHFGLIASTGGLLIYRIYRGHQSRMSPYLQSIGNFDNSTVGQHIAASSSKGNYYFLNTIYYGHQTLIIMDGTKHSIIKTVDLNCTDLNSPALTVSKDEQTVFVTNCGNITAIHISSIKSASIVGTLSLGNAWGVACSDDSKYLYVSNQINKEIYILSYKENEIKLLSTISVSNYGVPTMISPSKNNEYLFVVIYEKGIRVLKIKNKVSPILVEIPSEVTKMGDARSLIYESDIYGQEFIVVSLYYEGMIKIVDVQNATNPSVVATKFIGKKAIGLGIFKSKNFLVVQSIHRITVLEIRNLKTPVIVSDIDSKNIKETYQIAVLPSYICLPTFEIFSIYSGNTFFYPYMESHTNNLGEKVFYVQFFAVNPVTMDQTDEKFSLLSVETGESWPYWMTVDYKSNLLTINPPSMESLLQTRKLILTFGTQISSTELESIGDISEVTRALVFENYIDAFSIPTLQFDPNVEIVLHLSTNLNKSSIDKIPGVLSQHLLTHYVTFTLQDFLNLDNQPEKGENKLQEQFNNLGTVLLNQRIDFTFDDLTFYDPDGDKLEYTAYGVPNFLTFSENNLKFYGTPTKEDIGIYPIMVKASDGYKSVDENFTIYVINNPPDATSVDNIYIHLGNKLEYSFPINTFIDPDGDKLQYNAEIVNRENGKNEELPTWLTLDDSRLRLFGEPSKDDIAKDLINGRFYQVFTINMSATDIADQMAYFLFNLTVENYFPKLNTNWNIQSQFSSKFGEYIKINQKVDFEFSSNTFFDKEDVLTYTIKNLPHWLSFGEKVFYGTPSKQDLGDYLITVFASDGYAEDFDVFNISVQNHPPIPQDVSDIFLIYGHTLHYPLKTSFIDADNDTLIYKVYLINSTTNQTQNVPNWLLFEENDLIFSGTPNEGEIPYISDSIGYYAKYNICLTATDPGDETAMVNFSITVQNRAPIVNPNKSLSSQIKNFDCQVTSTAEFQFDEYTFIDANNDTIFYEARLLSSESDWGGSRRILQSGNGEPLPNWIQFDDKNRKFSMKPESDLLNYKITIKVFAKNSKMTSSDTFSFIVKISASYAFQIFISVMGALGSFVGLLVYRKTFYSILGKRFYCYSEYEKVLINSNFYKTIYMIQEDLEFCETIWKKVKKNNKNLRFIFDSDNRNELLKEAVFKANRELIEEKVINDSSETSSLRVVEIFQHFLFLEVSNQFPEVQKIFKRIKKNLSVNKNKMWYSSLVKILPNNLENETEEELIKPFPSVSIKEKSLIKIYDALKKPKDPNYMSLTDNFKLLLHAKIKAEVLGVPHPLSKLDTFMEFSRGESLYLTWMDISEIQIIKKRTQTPFLHESLFDYPKKNYFNTFSIWLSYKIDKGMLIFTGKPTQSDIGKHIVRIFNSDDVIVREFGVEVIEKNENRKSIVDTWVFSNSSPYQANMLMSPLDTKGFKSISNVNQENSPVRKLKETDSDLVAEEDIKINIKENSCQK